MLSPKRKHLPEENLTLVRVDSMKELQQHALAGDIENILLVGGSMRHEDLMADMSMHHIPLVPMGAVLLHGEACFADPPHDIDANDVWENFFTHGDDVEARRRDTRPIPGSPTDYRMQFAFITYGDCFMLDNVRVKLWPLGLDKKINSMLDAHTMPRTIPTMAQRNIDINHIGSLRKEKTTRAQAVMAMSEVCTSLGLACASRTGVTLHQALGSLDDLLGNKNNALQTWFAGHLPDDYNKLLLHSKVTLSPAGTAPECGRTLEAVVMGSIPVIEVWDEEGNAPLYSKSKCLRGDNNAFYRDSNAPVFWVRDWRNDLPTVAAALADTARMQVMQDDLRVWYGELVGSLRTSVLHQCRTYMRQHGKPLL